MADFNTNHREELLIDRVRKVGFGYDEESEFPKYFVLRVALAWAMNAPHLPLESMDWERKRLEGDKGKEYHMEQITGKGKDKKEDFDLLIRSMLYIKHKEELDRDKKDIFSDEKEYLKILSRYIQRGLYELDNTYKSSDCFYQWCLDNLHLSFKKEGQIKENAQTNSKEDYFSKIQAYCKKQGIDIKLMNEEDSYRHHICKVELLDSDKIQFFENKSQYLDKEIGESVFIESCKGFSKVYSIQIAKPQTQWKNLGLKEFQQGLLSLQRQNYTLGVFAGMNIDKEPFCFDLKDTPHLFVAGTTGSGKSVFLKTMVLCLLRNKNVEIVIVDPKRGVSFKEFENIKAIHIIKDNESAIHYMENLVTLMDERYEHVARGDSFDNMSYKILIVDELNDLIDEKPQIKDSLKRLAQKARESKIHLVLGTQRPDGTTLRGLKTNIPSSIALQTKNVNESKIILDRAGAEKLLGKGDMFIQVSSTLSRVFGIYLSEEEIQKQLEILNR